MSRAFAACSGGSESAKEITVDSPISALRLPAKQGFVLRREGAQTPCLITKGDFVIHTTPGNGSIAALSRRKYVLGCKDVCVHWLFMLVLYRICGWLTPRSVK
jgi:hypothetical protein